MSNIHSLVQDTIAILFCSFSFALVIHHVSYPRVHPVASTLVESP